MANPARVGGSLVAGAFFVYLVTDILGYYTTLPAFELSILGTILLFVGVTRLMKTIDDPPKWLRVVVIVSLVGSLVAGRIANGLLLLAETPDALRTGVYAATAQVMLLAVAAAIPLSMRGSTLVRALCAAGVLGTLAFGILFHIGLQALMEARITLGQYDAMMVTGLVLSDLMLVAALAFTFSSSAGAAGTPSPVANPFAVPTGAAVPAVHSGGLGAGPAAAPAGGPGMAAAGPPAGVVAPRQADCPKCQARNLFAPGQKKVCTSCGFGG